MEVEPEEEDAMRCRICCGREVDELISLYCQCDSQQQLVTEMIRALVKLGQPHENDNLPQFVCGECLSRLDKGCTFQKLCFASDNALRRKLFMGEWEEDTDGCCRLCITEEAEELISVHCVYPENGKTIADMINEAIGVSLPKENDDLPQHICVDCFERLKETNSFIELILQSDTELRGDPITKLAKEDKMDVEQCFDKEEDGWVVPKKQIRTVLTKPDEMDPFIYLESPDVDADRLMPLFCTTEDAEFYEQLRFDGIICCCGKLMENQDEWVEHRTSHYSQQSTIKRANKCEDCQQKFRLLGELTEHMENREKKLFYRCKICNILTKERTMLQLHFEFTRFHPMLDISEEERKYFDDKIETVYEPDSRCCDCNKEFADGESLLEHTKRRHFEDIQDLPLFMCTICYNSFTEKQQLMKHQLTYKGTTTYICREEGCQFKADQRAVMRGHVESGRHFELDKLPAVEPIIVVCRTAHAYFCCFFHCSESFKTLPELEAHCADVHVEQRTANSQCSAQETDGNICPLCQRHFQKKTLFQAHILSQTVRNFCCSTCGRRFTSRLALVKHENNHDPGSKPENRCNQCGELFSGSARLKLHVRTVHDKIIDAVCVTCGQIFANKKSLKQHEMNRHMPDRPYKCTLCSKSFGMKHMLQRHTITHSSERPYKCTSCSNSYRHHSDLKRHELAVHLNLKPFECELCGSAYIRERDLRLHMTTHTGIKLFNCPVCGFGTNIAKELRRHEKSKHCETSDDDSEDDSE